MLDLKNRAKNYMMYFFHCNNYYLLLLTLAIFLFYCIDFYQTNIIRVKIIRTYLHNYQLPVNLYFSTY